ncbi:MAG: lipopolysaccharide kinase InaA family protein [Gemmatimonadota bacterium]|nr:lipopolysaccharide kinase InaA family protein [Gemmatimonadota bacterium]
MMEAPGYVPFRVGDADGMCLASLLRSLTEALDEGTVYDYAAHHPRSRQLTGRGIAYAVPLPDDAADVVVRRSRHGGLLAPLTGERFLGATRAPHELRTSLRLTRLGVPTPEILAYATYPAGSVFRSADVVTREVHGGQDLAEALIDAEDADSRRELLAATVALLALLASAGVRHPDLNLKNVLVRRDDDGQLEALLLDVDRVWFDDPAMGRAREANMRRFARSARKWRRFHGCPLDEDDLAWMEREVRSAASVPR